MAALENNEEQSDSQAARSRLHVMEKPLPPNLVQVELCKQVEKGESSTGPGLLRSGMLSPVQVSED